jgi:hypothetical protein
VRFDGAAKETAMKSKSKRRAQLREKLDVELGKAQKKAELRRLADAVAQNGASGFLLEALREREKALCEMSNQLLSDSPQSVDAELAVIRGYVTTRLADIRSLLAKNVPLARVGLAKHVREIRMQPSTVGAERFYVAEGEWNLLGSFPGTGPTRQPSDWRVRMVGGLDLNQRPLGYEQARRERALEKVNTR